MGSRSHEATLAPSQFQPASMRGPGFLRLVEIKAVFLSCLEGTFLWGLPCLLPESILIQECILELISRGTLLALWILGAADGSFLLSPFRIQATEVRNHWWPAVLRSKRGSQEVSLRANYPVPAVPSQEPPRWPEALVGLSPIFNLICIESQPSG